MDKAVGLAAAILEARERDVATLTLIPASGGVFEVERDGDLLFSKKKEGRFPEHSEVLDHL